MILYRGDVLFREGESGDLFRINRGLLKVVKTRENGDVFLFNILVPGEVVPHATLITPGPYPGTAVALTECEVERIPAKDWYRALDEYPGMYREAALMLEFTIRKVQKRVSMTTVPKAERLSHFTRWLRSYCLIERPDELLTQEEIGQFLGMSRETVNRYLNRRKS
ncbi:Crp/Fnr family transcriptional regulator [Staphylospora marina]|uniref:Crp/Fnr family transcriptional regulator n=1 Tax=Staphylospora marina TaxID=2490858 RepID=UPI000F5BE141|nr:Crp/Fnr family transcriptional regulator [Staphylospora marina]